MRHAMSDPMTDPIDRLRLLHRRCPRPNCADLYSHCDQCGQGQHPYPCDVIAALDALEERAESMQAAFDVIWRLSCLPFTDDDRKGIQGIALAFIDGKGPQPGSQIAHLLAGDKEAE